MNKYNKIKLLLLLLYVFFGAGCAFKHQELGPDRLQPMLLEDVFVAVDGKRLALSIWAPGPAPWAVVIAVHGFNDYRDAFADPGVWLAGQGVVVLAYDQRGFGEDEKAGFWAKKETLASDLQAMIALVRAKYPDLPLFVMGESMGGAVALYTLGGDEKAADGLILVAPAVWGWRPLNIIYKPALWLTARLMPGKKFSGRTLKREPSDNIDALIAMSKDPLVIKKTRIDAIVGLTRMMKHGMKAAPDIKIPTLQVYGEKDDMVPDKMFRRLLKRLPANQTSSRIYENGYHLLLRGCNRGEVWKDILDFMTAQAAIEAPGPLTEPEEVCQPPTPGE